MKLHEFPARVSRHALTAALLGGMALAGCVDSNDPSISPPGNPSGQGDDPQTSDLAEEPLVGTLHVAGPAKVTDVQNDIVLDLPAGWHAIVPTQGRGSTTIANYDMRYVENVMPEHSSHAFRDDMAKVDITAIDLEAGDTLDTWVDRRHMEILNGKVGPENTLEAARSASDMIVYRLAELDGYAYGVQVGMTSSVEIVLPWGEDRVLLATVLPARASQELDATLPILDGLRTLASERASAPVAKRGKELTAPIAALLADGSWMVEKAGECSLWTGSDTGSAAPNTPITLNLPFYWQTWWQAGGAGAFWGNLFHGNCYDDYYAIDFNRVSSSSCSSYLDDSGQNVYPSASGTAYRYSSSTGYGNRVDVYHSNGLMTRYAHLQAINVSNGQSVTTQTVIGWVGTTGNSGGPHLHYGFYQNGVSRCNESDGRCPNNELSKSPQTPKPSPMYTNLGSKTISDGSCYQAPP